MKNKFVEKFINLWKVKRNQKLMFSFFVLFVLGGVFVGTTTSAIPIIGGLLSDAATDLANALVWVASQILLFLSRLAIKAALFCWEYFIELAAYNDFINAPPVTIGWVMIRDFANMFFIVALMVIAIGTVLGVEQYEWKKSLVKLIFAAIFINFSKLILQLIIDFAQVIMNTFLIAFADQSGNQLINIFKFGQMTEIISSQSPTDGLNWEIFVGAVVALVLSVLVFLTILSYLAVMVGRMIVLWMLMIISPLAFVLSAFPFGKQYASEFWKNFFNYAMVGPIMVFFTWLAFASLQTGTIAKDVNLNVSKLKSAGATEIANVDPALSINKASDWESLSSYLIALGFFVVGITMVQRMGVVGGQLTSRAMDFSKKVATIASGYAAGRWLVDRGARRAREAGEGVLEAGGDYIKLAEHKALGGIKHELARTPIIGSFTKAGKLRRKAAVKRVEDIETARATQYSKEGPRGISKILAPKKAEVAKEQFEAEEATKISDIQMQRLRDQATKEYYEGDLSKFYKNKVDLIQAKLGVDVKGMTEKDKEGNEVLDDNGNTISLYDKLQKAVKDNNYNAAEGVMGSMEGQIRKGIEEGSIKASYEPADKRELDREAAAGTYMIRRALEEAYAEEEKGDEEVRRSWIQGVYNHSYLQGEERAAVDRMKASETKLVNRKVAEDILEEDPNWRTKNAREKEESLNKMVQDISSGALAVDKARREKVVKGITEREKRQAYADDGVYEGLAKIGGDYFLYESQNRVRKHKSESEGWQKRTMDYARAIEGKSTNNREEWEKAKAAGDIKEIIESMTYEQLEEKLLQNGADIKKLRSKESLTSEEQKALRSAVQQQVRYLSAFMEEHSGSFAGLAGSLDDSYQTEEIEKRENIGKVVAGLLSGKSWGEVSSDDGFKKTETELNKHFKEKKGRLFRMLERGMNSAAGKGATTFYRQVSEGVDENGERAFGFTANFTDGIGNKTSMGTGKAGQDGSVWQKEQEEIMLQSALNTNMVKDPRLLFVRDGRGRLRGFQSNKAAETHEGYAYLPSSKLTDMSQAGANTIWGGKYEASSYDPKKNKFTFETEEVRRSVANMASKAVEKFRDAKGNVNKQRTLSELRTLLYVGNMKQIEDINGNMVDIYKAKIQDIVKFLNDKLIKTGGDSPEVLDPSMSEDDINETVKEHFKSIRDGIKEMSPEDLGEDFG